MKTVTLAVVILACPLVWAYAESVVTLKSGEVLQGEILSDSNDVLQIRAFFKNHTIFMLRDIPQADIQSIQTQTPAQVAEQTDCEALSKFRLNPDQEQTLGWYDQWIAAFKTFVSKYPASDKIPTVKHNIESCQTEGRNVADGKVKYNNEWMTVEEKHIQAAQHILQKLKSRLADLQNDKKKLAEQLEVTQQNLESVQATLPTLRPVPTHRKWTGNGYIEVGGGISSEQITTGNEIKQYEQQLLDGQSMMNRVDSQIADTQSQIPNAEGQVQSALQQAQDAKEDAKRREEQAKEEERRKQEQIKEEERKKVAAGNHIQADISVIATVVQITNRDSYDWNSQLTVLVNSRYKYDLPHRYQTIKTGEAITVNLTECTDIHNPHSKFDPSTSKVTSVTVSLDGHDFIALDVKPD